MHAFIASVITKINKNQDTQKFQPITSPAMRFPLHHIHPPSTISDCLYPGDLHSCPIKDLMSHQALAAALNIRQRWGI